jgi:ribonuclease VapC
MNPVLVIDTSVLVAIAKRENDAGLYLQTLGTFKGALAIPSPVYLEAVSVLSDAPGLRTWLDRFLSESAIAFLPTTERTARLAADAFERFGRGSGHPARLNFGDCLAYAAAAEQDAALLFKGADFAHTDVKRAL